MSTEITSGQRLIVLRRKLGLSQQKLSEISGVSKSYIGDVESGRSAPSANMVKKIACVTNVNIDWLMTGEGEMFRSEQDLGGQINETAGKYDRRVKAFLTLLEGLSDEDRDAILDEAFARAQTAQQIAELRQTVADIQRKTRA